jgi:hypothetical protein
MPNGATINRAHIHQNGRVKLLNGFQQLNGEVKSGVRHEFVHDYDMVHYKFLIGFMEHASSAFGIYACACTAMIEE